jgi:hypothetical protein
VTSLDCSIASIEEDAGEKEKEGRVNDTNSSRILFLGAGFSRLAGLPLGAELFSDVRARAMVEDGPKNRLERDLERFIRYLKECDDRLLTEEDVDPEEFLAFLDLEHFLGLKGKDTLSYEGNGTQLLIRHSIGRILLERSPKVIPKPYRQFAQRLTPQDWVFTFNYDTLLERALDEEGIAYRLYPFRYSEVGALSSTIDNSHDELVVIKLHGSIDWFDRTGFDKRLEVLRDYAPPYNIPRHPIFGRDALVHPVSLTDGPRPPDDSLRCVFRVADPSPIYCQFAWDRAPLLLTPSRTKFLYVHPLKDFWWGLQRMGGLNLSLAIIGYSLPVYDEYIRQVLYYVTRNFTEFEPDLSFEGNTKSMVRVLDHRSTLAEVDKLRSRYRFVNPDRCEFWLEGFSEEGVDWLFR